MRVRAASNAIKASVGAFVRAPKPHTLLEEATSIKQSLFVPSSLRDDILDANDRMVALRRFCPVKASESMGVPASPILTSDHFLVRERGWPRTVLRTVFGDEGGRSQQISRPSSRSARQVPVVTVLKPTDLQIHEVCMGQVVYLKRAPLKLDEKLVERTDRRAHFHFVLFRQSTDLVSTIQFLSLASGGTISPSAFHVNVVPCDASGCVTQRISVRTTDLKGLGEMLYAANTMTAGQNERYCRLEPIGFSSRPCGPTGDETNTQLQYTALLRGLTGAPRSTIKAANSALCGPIANYFSNLHFGGSQPLVALSAVHEAIREGNLHDAVARLLAASSFSGHLGFMCAQHSRQREVGHFNPPKPPAEESQQGLHGAEWFSKSLALVGAPPDSVSQHEFHELLHSEIPLSIREAIKHSSLLLAWNATASCVLAHYDSEPHQKDASMKSSLRGLPLPVARGTVGGQGETPPTNNLFNVPSLGLAWDRKVDGHTTIVPAIAQFRPVEGGLPAECLGDALLPVGMHSFEGSVSNIGLAATGVGAFVGSECHGYRPLLTTATGVESLVLQIENSRVGRGSTFLSGLLSDAALIHESPSRVNAVDLRQRIPSSLGRCLKVTADPRQASEREALHSLVVRFRLAPSTDPSPVLMPFVAVESKVPFVPENNRMHVTRKPLALVSNDL